jgi:two-component system nitrogen regulation sensor histidine kinase NtrY
MKWRSAGFSFNVSIQKRIQVVFVLLLLVMLIIVAIGTVYYTVQQFERKHLELLENKVQSIMLELEYKIGLDGPVTASPDEYLNYHLQMISNVFYCDINLYGVDGMLLGSSRPELFSNGLAGIQMNPRAYYNLAYTDAVRHLDEEKIGDLSYISVYVPLLDSDNRLSGFVNLPYFVGNNELREEVSSVIVTVVNFYLIFTFFVISLAVFLARQITRPLLFLQSKISQLKLDRFNDKIDYKGEDEIGGLVAEYNRMVDELAISAGKLA